MKRWLKWLFWLGGSLFLLMLIMGVVLLLWFDKPLPEGKIGPEADALAKQMLAAVNHDAWLETGAVAWDFDGRQQHLWDRERHFARVRWKNFEVLLNLSNRQGVVRQDGREVTDDQRVELLDRAWAHWANDSFWLNPVSKVFDEGTRRELVQLDNGKQALLVTYASGGVTPGDSYLWILDESGRPKAWKMWVQILPLGGIPSSWEGWQKTATGALLSSKHKISVLTLGINDIRCGRSLKDLTSGQDPFADLLQ